MSKQNYAVCCYTCEHNGQETCKGCNTILNGENEPYENWELREDLCSKDQKIKDLEDKLTDREKQIEDSREAGNMAVDSWCKNRRKYEAQIAEMQNKSFILYSMLYEALEKQGCENVASQIDQMTGWVYDKEADWLKGNRNYDQLKQKLTEKDQQITDLQHRLDVAEKALELACKQLQDDYCINCNNQTNCSRVEMCERSLSIYLPSDFKEQAESESKGD